MKIIARNILDNTPAAFCERARPVHKLCSDQKVTSGPVKMAERRIEPRGNCAPYGCVFEKRNNQWQELVFFGENSCEFCQTHSRVDANRQVARIVVRDSLKTSHIERHIIA